MSQEQAVEMTRLEDELNELYAWTRRLVLQIQTLVVVLDKARRYIPRDGTEERDLREAIADVLFGMEVHLRGALRRMQTSARLEE